MPFPPASVHAHVLMFSIFRTHSHAQIRYAASGPSLPTAATGNTFVAVFGAATPCLEALLIKHRIKGPCWLRLAGATRVDAGNQVRSLVFQEYLPIHART